MSSDIPESDWKAFRKLREVALERFCERVMSDIDRIVSARDMSFHKRYLQIFELITERDGKIARAFNNPRRSTAIVQLVAMRALDLVTEEELLVFTPATQTVVQELTQHRDVTRGRSGA